MEDNIKVLRKKFDFSNINLQSIRNYIVKNNAVFIFLVLVVVASLVSDSFFTEKNIFNVLRQVAAIGIISMGMLFVILTGGIDLSVGSVVALSSVCSAYFLQDYPLIIALVLSLAVGSGVGMLSGYLVSISKIAPFVVTLAFMTIAKGFAYIISEGAPIMTDNPTLIAFGSSYFMKIPYPVLLMLLIFVGVLLTLRYTSFGRLVMAIGSNEECVRLSGINVTKYKFSVYVISAAFATVGGIISTARTGVGSPLVGNGFELDAIASVVIGGASISGGKGTALNTLMGVLILGVIGNIMNLTNVPSYPQQVIKGIIIIAAVLFQQSKSKTA